MAVAHFLRTRTRNGVRPNFRSRGFSHFGVKLFLGLMSSRESSTVALRACHAIASPKPTIRGRSYNVLGHCIQRNCIDLPLCGRYSDVCFEDCLVQDAWEPSWLRKTFHFLKEDHETLSLFFLRNYYVAKLAILGNPERKPMRPDSY